MNSIPPLEPWTDPADEARVVAWVLGEASEFEKAEIERLLADNPELAAFARRIQAVHGLLGDAHQPEPATDEWKLSPERRAAVAALFGEIPTNPVGGDAPLSGPGGGKPRRWVLPLSLVAAVLIVGLVVFSWMFLGAKAWKGAPGDRDFLAAKASPESDHTSEPQVSRYHLQQQGQGQVAQNAPVVTLETSSEVKEFEGFVNNGAPVAEAPAGPSGPPAPVVAPATPPPASATPVVSTGPVGTTGLAAATPPPVAAPEPAKPAEPPAPPAAIAAAKPLLPVPEAKAEPGQDVRRPQTVTISGLADSKPSRPDGNSLGGTGGLVTDGATRFNLETAKDQLDVVAGDKVNNGIADANGRFDQDGDGFARNEEAAGREANSAWYGRTSADRKDGKKEDAGGIAAAGGSLTLDGGSALAKSGAGTLDISGAHGGMGGQMAGGRGGFGGGAGGGGAGPGATAASPNDEVRYKVDADEESTRAPARGLEVARTSDNFGIGEKQKLAELSDSELAEAPKPVVTGTVTGAWRTQDEGGKSRQLAQRESAREELKRNKESLSSDQARVADSRDSGVAGNTWDMAARKGGAAAAPDGLPALGEQTVTASLRAGDAAVTRNSIDSLLGTNASPKPGDDAQGLNRNRSKTLGGSNTYAGATTVSGGTLMTGERFAKGQVEVVREAKPESSPEPAVVAGKLSGAKFPVTPATPTSFERLADGTVVATEYDAPQLPNQLGVASDRTDRSDRADQSDLGKDRAALFGDVPVVGQLFANGNGTAPGETRAKGEKARNDLKANFYDDYNAPAARPAGGEVDAKGNFQLRENALENEGKMARPEDSQAGRVAELEKRLEAGKSDLLLGNYDGAERELTEVLKSDKYNNEARKGLEQIDRAKSEYFGAAYNHTRARMIPEVDEKWETPPPVETAALEKHLAPKQVAVVTKSVEVRQKNEEELKLGWMEGTEGGKHKAEKPSETALDRVVAEAKANVVPEDLLEGLKNVKPELAAQLQEQQERLRRAQAGMLKRMREYNVVDFARAPAAGQPAGDDEVDTGGTNIIKMSQENISQLQGEIETLRTQSKSIQGLEGDELIRKASGLGIKDATIEKLYPQWNDLVLQEKQAKEQGLGDNHPTRVQIRSQMDTVKGMLGEAATSARDTLGIKLQQAERKLAVAQSGASAREEDYISKNLNLVNYQKARDDYMQQKDALKQMLDQARKDLAERGVVVDEPTEGLPSLDGTSNSRPNPKATICKKLATINIPTANFEGTTLGEAVEFLKQQARENDSKAGSPEARGVNIFVRGQDENGAKLSEKTVAGIQLRNLPVGELLQYLAEDAGMQVKVEEHAVVIEPRTTTVAYEIATGPGPMAARLDQPIAPKVAFSGTLGEALESLKIMEKDLGKDGTIDPNFLVLSGGKPGVDLSEIKIPELEMQNASMRDVLEALAKHTGLRYRVDRHAIVFQPDPDIDPAALLARQAREAKKAEEAKRLAALNSLESGDTARDPVSTFSLHVSDSSFKLSAASLLEKGRMPEAAGVRTEDFVNAFDYGDPLPSAGEAVSCGLEQAAHPFVPGRNLVRIGMRTAASGRGETQPLRLTILLDNSGSMDRPDRAAAVESALGQLAALLKPDDQVTLVGFARTPRLLADRLPGNRANELVKLARQAPPAGGTNIEAALDVGTQSALRQFSAQGVNRVVLITDGAANLGNIEPEKLSARIEGLRQQKVAFDACGVGTDGLDDAMLEALTRKGDGRYIVLGQAKDADAAFATELAGAFRPSARNVKVQVRFNPDRVGKFHLLGFEKHVLKEEDFRNDKVDAAEMAAAEEGNALYQVELRPNGQGEIGDVAVRFEDVATGRMVERHWTIPYDPSVATLDRAQPTMQLAATAGLLGERLKGSPIGGLVRLDDLTSTLNSLRQHFPANPKVGQLTEMVRKAADLTR